MKQKGRIGFFTGMALMILCGCNSNAEKGQEKLKIGIILGSTRQGRSSDKIALAINHFLAKRTDISPKLVDIKDYHINFLEDEITPDRRTVITDPIIQRWSDEITASDAFIIVVPEYNAGYPGVLKNALDVLYKEWNGKPVAFVGYSGGPSGGTSAVAQLRAVTKRLKMIPVECQINIPSAWKAFDGQENLLDTTIEKQLNKMTDQLIEAKLTTLP